MTEEKRRARLAVRRAVTKLTKRAMAATFERWSDVVVELRRQRVIVRRVLARVTERVKSSAFRDWLDALETRKEAEAADQAAWRRDVVKSSGTSARCDTAVSPTRSGTGTRTGGATSSREGSLTGTSCA